MADNRYGDDRRREGWRDRDSSIFSDDDDHRRRGAGRWQGEQGRGDDERGFLDRAGDEVRSWFGDEEAERRRERDMMRDDARSAFGGFEGGESREGRRTLYRGGELREGGVRFGGEPAWGREEGIYGRSPREERGLAGGSQWDENYRRWRSRQLDRFDREYEEYRRERQQAFEKDFDSWRSSRLTQSGTPSATRGGRSAGQTLEGGSATAGASTAGATARPAESGQPAGRSRGGRSTS